MKIFGVDASLRHGAVVSVSFGPLPERDMESIELMYLWSKDLYPLSEGVGIKEDFEDWEDFAFSVLRGVSLGLLGKFDIPHSGVAIDASKHVAFMGGRINGVAITFLSGIIATGLQDLLPNDQARRIRYYSPPEVRKALGLKGNAKKEDVHKFYRAQFGPGVFEAIVLSYIQERDEEFLVPQTATQRKAFDTLVSDVVDAVLLADTMAKNHDFSNRSKR